MESVDRHVSPRQPINNAILIIFQGFELLVNNCNLVAAWTINYVN